MVSLFNTSDIFTQPDIKTLAITILDQWNSLVFSVDVKTTNAERNVKIERPSA